MRSRCAQIELLKSADTDALRGSFFVPSMKTALDLEYFKSKL